MCGRYALALRPSQIRQMLEDDDMPVYGAPADEDDDADADEDEAGPRRSYNFAPGYRGVVYRADAPVSGGGAAPAAGERGGRGGGESTDGDGGRGKGGAGDEDEDAPVMDAGTRYILQTMKWGLVPSWTRHKAGFSAKTINCRDDSLARPGGMWASMKARKRCVVVAQGFYEWLKPHGPRGDKVPHYVRRADGRLMCLAGLWDRVRYEGDEAGGKYTYTYTIVTTDSNEQLRFLHDRMPVILDQGSDAMRAWLDPGRDKWSAELQALLRPYSGALDVYPVSREVGKVGNDSPTFIIPVAKEKKGGIANFFANAAASSPKKRKKEDEEEGEGVKVEPGVEVRQAGAEGPDTVMCETVDEAAGPGAKREASSPPPRVELPPAKKGPAAEAVSPVKGRTQISATSNAWKSPGKAGKSPSKARGNGKGDGSRKITQFFANST
ncbi:embryonic stem cell-specific 5-hydroxymethylcytosine-binding protein [Phialemonium atrogriseum]|uniref:Embryonic stem cell-specific 5-hydroxymethylcytosine-binding protein n=1 Tax=Phialemonium atrogriseum TaxID=1093897 RepID=A0AAJ0BR43_9PEZI|nr:embryonic stem cell-specific 5-hydroxymethylcytosine-binding protein [Phialemonium atrogriseum]KAK1762939.1 embryonic stem cell-specific 5-hydroxymethylcytosine-binding protein [Phialemonium atrogriseum]